MSKLPDDAQAGQLPLEGLVEASKELLAKAEGAQLSLELPAETARGKYDVSRLDKRLVNAVTGLLAMHFLSHKAIAEMCGVSWETVAAIAAFRAEPIRQFKGRMAQRLALMMEAMTPVLMEKIHEGKVTFLDLKLVHDTWAPLAGEATSIVETRGSTPALDGLMKVIGEVVAGKQAGSTEDTQRMGLETGGNLPMAAGGTVQEAEIVELGVPMDNQSPDNGS